VVEEPPQRPQQTAEFEICPHCNYALIGQTSRCQYCGFQITYPLWKKFGAWILLILITYGLIKCHLRLIDGFV